MARPLTKTETDGALYARPPGVEVQIDEATRLSFADLRAREVRVVEDVLAGLRGRVRTLTDAFPLYPGLVQ